jgi:hypothetical protein
MVHEYIPARPSEKPSLPRLALIYGLILLTVGGMFFCSLTNTEWWPLCGYPMFSGVSDRDPRNSMEIHLVHEGKEDRFPTEEGLLNREFDKVTTLAVLKRIEKKFGLDSDEMRTFLKLVIRRLNVISDEPVSSLKLYRIRYEFTDPQAYRPVITNKVLLLEVPDDN